MLKGFDLSGRVAIITGGGTGIGRDTALLLAERGADVVVSGRRAEPLEKTAADIRVLGRRALAVPTDVRKPEASKALSPLGSVITNRLSAAFGFAVPSAAIARGMSTMPTPNAPSES